MITQARMNSWNAVPMVERRTFTISRRKAIDVLGAFHVFWSGGCDATGPPIEVVGPAIVFDAAFDCEQGVGARFRPAVP